MSTPNDHRDFQWKELDRLTTSLDMVRSLGFGPGTDVYDALWKARGAAFGKLGLAKPRLIPLVLKLVGLSPGELRLFQDAEIGWRVETTIEPGARPVYKYVSDEVAATLLKGELTHALEDVLMAPEDEFIA